MCESSLSCKWLIDKELVCWFSPLSFYLYTWRWKSAFWIAVAGGESQGVFLLNFTIWYRLIRNDTARQDKSANGLTSPWYLPAKVMFKLRHVNFKNFCLFIAVFFLLHSKNTFFSQLLSSSTPKFPSLDTAWFFLFFWFASQSCQRFRGVLLMNDLKFFAWPEGKAACASKRLKTLANAGESKIWVHSGWLEALSKAGTVIGRYVLFYVVFRHGFSPELIMAVLIWSQMVEF